MRRLDLEPLAAHVALQTASERLDKMMKAELLKVERQRRHRFYGLASAPATCGRRLWLGALLAQFPGLGLTPQEHSRPEALQCATGDPRCRSFAPVRIARGSCPGNQGTS